MRKMKKYSLWLMPSGKVYKKLAKIISQLNREYSAPKFLPHVTLLPSTIGAEKEILLKTAQLANLISPFEIKLTNVDYLNEYFRCLFIKAAKSRELMETNLKAREIFNLNKEPKFMPHLSLMYGNFDPKIKEKIIRKIGKKFNLKFKVKSVNLFLTEGKPKKWRKIKRFVLKLKIASKYHK